MMCRRTFSSRAGPVFSKFTTFFDGKCAKLISDKLEPFPSIELRFLPPFGNGLFARRDLSQGETAFRETPLLSTAVTTKDKRVKSVVKQARNPGWIEDYLLVAQAVAMIVDDLKFRQHANDQDPVSFANKMIAMRCLGWTSPVCVEPEYRIVRGPLYRAIQKEFNLLGTNHPAVAWTPVDCQNIYDKIKANMFQSSMLTTDVFVVASMLNHSCQPNVEFNRKDPAEVQVIRDIPSGEQLFINYGVRNPAIDLPELYGFSCTCKRCMSSRTVA